MPFAIAAIACSRMPKWKLRPPRLAASKSPAPSNVRCVFVDGARSAEPPIEPRHALGDGVQHLARRVDGSRGPSRRRGRSAGPRPSPPGARGAGCARARRPDRDSPRRYFSNVRLPRVARLAPARRRCRPRSGRTRRRGRRSPRPRGSRRSASCALTAFDPERLTVRLGASPRRRAVADVAVHDDQRRAIALGLEGRGTRACIASRSLASATVVTFQPYAMKRAATSSVNAMSVWPSIVTRLRVVDPAQVREPLMRGERRRL